MARNRTGNHSAQHHKQSCNGDRQNKPKIIHKKYHVTSQTAYNVAKLAMMLNTSEGRVIDKLVRNYMISQIIPVEKINTD